jgi:leader peptidase (prepilin peptidase)/N-methyltransferase
MFSDIILFFNDFFNYIKYVIKSTEFLLNSVDKRIGFIIIFIFGTIFGSFINVLIYRLPLEMDFIFKSSFCPKCGNPIKWYHNIPLISYIILKGRCYYCKEKISFQYPVIEFISGLVFGLLYLKFGITWDFFVLALFYIISLPVIVIDFKYQIIPDELTIGGIVIGLILALLRSLLSFQLDSSISLGIFDSLMAIIVNVLIFVIIYYLSFFIYRKEGLGFGDVKLAATIGSFLGVYPSLVSFFFSFLFGSILGLLIMIINKIINYKKVNLLKKYVFSSGDYLSTISIIYVVKTDIDKKNSVYIAFGPFMILGAWFAIFFTNFILDTFFLTELGF